MRRLALQVLAVVFALSVAGLVVANAAATSGCSGADPIAKDPRPPAVGSTPAAAPSSVSSTAAVAPSAVAPASAALPAPSTAQIPIENAPYLGGTKSGLVFRPKPNVAPPAAKGSAP